MFWGWQSLGDIRFRFNNLESMISICLNCLRFDFSFVYRLVWNVCFHNSNSARLKSIWLRHNPECCTLWDAHSNWDTRVASTKCIWSIESENKPWALISSDFSAPFSCTAHFSISELIMSVLSSFSFIALVHFHHSHQCFFFNEISPVNPVYTTCSLAQQRNKMSSWTDAEQINFQPAS